MKKQNYSWFLISLVIILAIIAFSAIIRHVEDYFKGVKEEKAAQYKNTLSE